jgi:hypothetical protein
MSQISNAGFSLLVTKLPPTKAFRQPAIANLRRAAARPVANL